MIFQHLTTKLEKSWTDPGVIQGTGVPALDETNPVLLFTHYGGLSGSPTLFRLHLCKQAIKLKGWSVSTLIIIKPTDN
jgi:hypothetical protein